MGLVDALSGSAGRRAYQAGISPANAPFTLAGDAAQRPKVRSAATDRPHSTGGGRSVSADRQRSLIWLAAGLRRAPHDAGVDLHVDDARRVAVDRIRHETSLASLASVTGSRRTGRGPAQGTACDWRSIQSSERRVGLYGVAGAGRENTQ